MNICLLLKTVFKVWALVIILYYGEQLYGGWLIWVIAIGGLIWVMEEIIKDFFGEVGK